MNFRIIEWFYRLVLTLKIDQKMDLEEIIPEPLNLIQDQDSMQKIVFELVSSGIDSKKKLQKFTVEKRKEYKLAIGNTQLLYTYRTMVKSGMVDKQASLEELLKAKVGRGLSGVFVITVMTSAYPKVPAQSGEKVEKFSCPYDCHYCPNEPGQPRSYLLNEPSVLRANRNNFDAISQFRDRGFTYITNGHDLDKVELLVLGGTWSSYPKEYKDEFIRDLFYAANTIYDHDYDDRPRPRLSIEKEQELNETSNCRIIGLTIETRPDQIYRKELQQLRQYGVTRVQLGIQHTDDNILKLINRQCTTKDTIKAIKLLKDCCFKVDIHIMPDLPGSNPVLDRDMFDRILDDPDLQADQWKIYPCEVTPYTKIKKWYEEGSYKPYGEIDLSKPLGDQQNALFELLIYVKHWIHPWIRLNRVIRDIPNTYIIGGNSVTNLRQHLQTEMEKRELVCRCIRCREVKNQKSDLSKAILVVREYEASSGTEHFISFESPDNKILYGFLRLRICQVGKNKIFPELTGCALIRELHVYGQVVRVNSDKKNEVQHFGFGRKLVEEAERISLENGYKRIAVISGVGVKGYYRKLGYFDTDNYLIKTMSESHEKEPVRYYNYLYRTIFFLVMVMAILYGYLFI